MRILVLIGAFLFALVVQAQAGDLPESFDFARYSGLIERSPFAAKAVAANFANLYLANAGKVLGVELVTVESRDDPTFKLYLSTAYRQSGSDSSNEWRLISVSWSEQPCETTATIARDGATATIRFQYGCTIIPPS